MSSEGVDVIRSLGAILSMELSPNLFLKDLTSMSQIGFTVQEDGTVVLDDNGMAVAGQDWTPFQVNSVTSCPYVRSDLTYDV